MLPAAVAIILSPDQRELLLIKRRDVPIWALIAGGIEEGESPEETCVREVEEESGLHVEIIRKVAEYTPVCSLGSFTHVFECRIVSGSIRTSDETSDVNFFSVNQLPRPFFDLHSIWISETLLNQKDTIKRPLNEVTYRNLFFYALRHPIQTFLFFLSQIGLPINR